MGRLPDTRLLATRRRRRHVLELIERLDELRVEELG